jgi:hypothetical protein
MGLRCSSAPSRRHLRGPQADLGGPLPLGAVYLSWAAILATVVWVHSTPPHGVCTPRAVSALARPAWVVMPSSRSYSTSSAKRWAARWAVSWRAWLARPPHRPPAPVAARHGSTRLGGRQGCLGAGAYELPLLLGHRRVDAERQLIGARHVGGPDRHALLQQLRQGAGVPGDPIQLGRHQHCAQLPATG